MRNAGINLENIFNQNSIGEKAIYDESVKTKINQEKILNKTKQAKKNVEKEVQSVNQKQKKIYETLEGYYSSVSLLLQKINVQDDPEIIRKVVQIALKTVKDAYSQTIKADKEVEKAILKAQNNIKNNITDSTFLKELQNITKMDLKTPSIIFQRRGNSLATKTDSEKKINAESQQIISQAFRDILRVAQGMIDVNGKDLNSIVSAVQHTSIKNAKIGYSDTSYIKNKLLKIEEQLYAYLESINTDANKELTDREKEHLRNVAKGEAYELLKHLSLNSNGKLVLQKFTTKKNTKIFSGSAAAALGKVTEKTFSGKPQDINLTQFLTDKNIQSLFTGGSVLCRTQYSLNEKISTTLDTPLKFDTNGFDFFNSTQITGTNVLRTKSGIDGKIDTIEKVSGKNNKNFIIAYSDKFVGGKGMMNISLIKNGASLISSLDLFINNPNREIMSQLYAAATSLTNASVIATDAERANLKIIADQVLSSFFMDMAFDASNFEMQLQESIQEAGLTDSYGTKDNVLYVMRATNTYQPASNILTYMIKKLNEISNSLLGKGQVDINNIVKSEIVYDTSAPGMDPGSLWDQGRHAVPNNNYKDARWAYVAAQAAENTKISASLNMALLNQFIF